jgi:antitoxin component YwqK of YwqJK toxin-antitoxin module
MSLITGNKVKKNTSQGIVKKYKANKRILRSLSFDNNGLVKPYWKVCLRHDSGMITLSIYHGK